MEKTRKEKRQSLWTVNYRAVRSTTRFVSRASKPLTRFCFLLGSSGAMQRLTCIIRCSRKLRVRRYVQEDETSENTKNTSENVWCALGAVRPDGRRRTGRVVFLLVISRPKIDRRNGRKNVKQVSLYGQLCEEYGRVWLEKLGRTDEPGDEKKWGYRAMSTEWRDETKTLV